jgi:single-strand DNA-binding protein
MNHVNLIGKMTSEPQYRELANGRKIAHFHLSTKESYLDKSGKMKNHCQWHRLYARGRWITVLEELGKTGLKIAIEGRIVNRFYVKNGKRNVVAEIEINDLIIL